MLNWLLSLTLLAGGPGGQVTVKTSDLEVLLTSKVAWTITSLDYRGDRFILPMGGQGAMLSSGGQWYGARAAGRRRPRRSRSSSSPRPGP